MKAKQEFHIMSGPVKTHSDHIEQSIYSENWHKEIEVLYIQNGTGEILYNFERINVSAGDVVVVNSNCVHAPASNKSMDIHCLIINSIFCETHGIHIENINFQPKIQDDILSNLIKNVITEFYLIDSFSTAALSAAVLNLVVYLARNHSIEVYPSDKKNRLQRIQDSIIYIQNNFSKHLTSKEVAQQINISESYFLHEFKTITNHTFSSYLNNFRCNHAKTLLITTNHSINQISEICGYENVSYFSKTFKELHSCSPLQYRKEHMKSNLKSFEPITNYKGGFYNE